MNHELLSLIRETGYLTDADLNAQARYDLLTRSFWQKAAELGYSVATFKRKLWRAAGLPEEEPRVLRTIAKASTWKSSSARIPTIPISSTTRDHCYVDLSQLDQGRELLHRCLELAPGHSHACVALAQRQEGLPYNTLCST